MNLRKIIGEGLIFLGAVGLLGGYSSVRYSMFQKQRGLSDRARAIMEITDYFNAMNFTFGEEYYNSPDVIATKREVARIKIADMVGKAGGYGGMAVGGLSLLEFVFIPGKGKKGMKNNNS